MNKRNYEKLYPQRRYTRLIEYDYRWPGAYFITICTHDKRLLFGNIINGLMNTNDYGKIVKSCWRDLTLHYQGIGNEIFVVMPNHVHGIISIQNTTQRSGLKPDPTPIHPITEIIRGFKTFSSKKINLLRQSPGIPVWQRSFYEHVIRSETDYSQITDYILGNPVKWDLDTDNPDINGKP
jgi:putative transposase